MINKSPRILYFISGSMPSPHQQADALRYGSNVTYRNAQFVPTEGAIEPCDGVAGDVPATYQACPDGLAVIQAYLAKTMELAYENKPIVPSAPPAPPAPPAPIMGWPTPKAEE